MASKQNGEKPRLGRNVPSYQGPLADSIGRLHMLRIRLSEKGFHGLVAFFSFVVYVNIFATK